MPDAARAGATRAARGHVELHDHGRARMPRAALRERRGARLARGRGGPHARRRAARAQRPERRARAPRARLRDPPRRAAAHARRQEPQGMRASIYTYLNLLLLSLLILGCLFSCFCLIWSKLRYIGAPFRDFFLLFASVFHCDDL